MLTEDPPTLIGDHPLATSGLAIPLAVGVCLPVMCLLFDPIVFRPSLTGHAVFGRYVVGSYVAILSSVAMVCLWISVYRFHAFFAGYFLASACLSLIFGFVLLPVTIIGLLMMVGVLGFSPFFVSWAYLRIARYAQLLGPKRFQWYWATLGFFTAIVPAVCAQAYAERLIDQSLTFITSSVSSDWEVSARTLKSLRVAVDVKRLENEYEEQTDADVKRQISDAYMFITGDDIEVRIADLDD